MSFVFLGVNRKLRKLPSVLNEIEMKATSINPKDHSYPFENLVFEGGGAKGHAYSGAVMVREYIVKLHCNSILMVYPHFCLAQFQKDMDMFLRHIKLRFKRNGDERTIIYQKWNFYPILTYFMYQIKR